MGKKLLALAISGALLSACGSDDNNSSKNDNKDGAQSAPAAPVTAKATGAITKIGQYQSGIYDDGGAEIVSFDASTDKLFVVNSGDATIDVLDLKDPANPQKLTTIDVKAASVNGFTAGGANSVAVKNGKLAVAVENDNKQGNGQVYFYNSDSMAFIGAAATGALPDMVTFTPNGEYVLSANEGEPNDAYDNDPEGSVSIIKVSDMTVRTAGFSEFNQDKQSLIEKGVRIGGPAGTSVAQDLEPEYITVDRDNKTAYVALQENNAIAVVNIADAEVTSVLPLGYKDHSKAGNGLDANKNDKAANIELLPIWGMYQPDSIASFMANDGKTYIVTANEGDGRDYDGFKDEADLKDLNLDAAAFSSAMRTKLGDKDGLGDLTVANNIGDSDNDGDFDKVYAYGARSFSIWNSNIQLVFDSGDQFEQKVKEVAPDNFNASNDKNKIDNRSDNKGPEPEGLALATLGDQTFAYIGLERQGGIMVYNITDPALPEFVQYFSDRNFAVEADENNAAAAGDLAPEGMLFISAGDSPSGKPLLVVGNEVSGTTSVYEIR
ncbi:choice-of-anchor I family protein [Bacterioplanoides sp.]|uniref:choice-of-anchor I family protein n=1 Tax=Bacterioplanoides sp. TaxID=2066072 RepID=UPI003B59261D